MLKNWVTETKAKSYKRNKMPLFQLYVKELSNWNFTGALVLVSLDRVSIIC